MEETQWLVRTLRSCGLGDWEGKGKLKCLRLKGVNQSALVATADGKVSEYLTWKF